MGAREEETGNVVRGAPIMGEPWWLVRRLDGTAFCCLKAGSWFAARDTGQLWNEGEPVKAELIFNPGGGSARS